MPQTIDVTMQGQIIGGTFSTRDNADKAVEAFHELGISANDIQVIVQINDNTAVSESVFTDVLTDNGFASSQAHFYDKALRDGKVLVIVHNVTEPSEVIDVFDRFKAEYNPNGSRNLREDVAGMTIGVFAGAVAGGMWGATIGGPLGAAAGVAAGIVIGGGTGAAAGVSAEHGK